jgi:outer membrane protein OmpA-like peptidoglycan-associated protein
MIVATTVLALIAVPGWVQADSSTVRSLVIQLRPRTAGQTTVEGPGRGLPRQGAMVAPAEPMPALRMASATPPRTAVAFRAPAPALPPEAVDTSPSADLNILFASGSAELTPTAMRLLDDLGRALTDASMGGSRFLIEGHTDTVGEVATNLLLSERRAQAVVSYLGARFLIQTDRLVAKGVGETGLLVPTSDETPEQRNRRVHVVNLDG